MPQSGQKLIYRFFTDSTGPATMWVPLNPNPWVSQLRSAGAHTDTFSPMCTHQPLAWLDFSPGASDMKVLFYMLKKKRNLQSIRNRSLHPPLCSCSTLCTDQQAPAAGIAQSKGGYWLWETCGSHKCGKHHHQHGKSP